MSIWKVSRITFISEFILMRYSFQKTSLFFLLLFRQYLSLSLLFLFLLFTLLFSFFPILFFLKVFETLFIFISITHYQPLSHISWCIHFGTIKSELMVSRNANKCTERCHNYIKRILPSMVFPHITARHQHSTAARRWRWHRMTAKRSNHHPTRPYLPTAVCEATIVPHRSTTPRG